MTHPGGGSGGTGPGGGSGTGPGRDIEQPSVASEAGPQPADASEEHQMRIQDRPGNPGQPKPGPKPPQ